MKCGPWDFDCKHRKVSRFCLRGKTSRVQPPDLVEFAIKFKRSSSIFTNFKFAPCSPRIDISRDKGIGGFWKLRWPKANFWTSLRPLFLGTWWQSLCCASRTGPQAGTKCDTNTAPLSKKRSRNCVLYYIENLSLWLDITIMFQTFKIVLQGRSASWRPSLEDSSATGRIFRANL